MMVKERTQNKEPPALDEGWWASILADEEIGGATLAVEAETPPETLLNWERAMALYRQDEIVTLTVTGYNRGGLLVSGSGLSGFVPCSHLVDLSPSQEARQREECLAAYVGRVLRLKIIECEPEDNRIVFSERAARAEPGRRTELFESLQSGQRVWGEVTNVTDFGAFVDLGGVEGLIHISELSWGRVGHPADILRVGQRVEVLVLEVSPERCRIALSLKRLFDNPWETIHERYPLNQVVSAKITAIVPFGAFARLEDGVEGLIHTSEIPLPPATQTKDFLIPGQVVQVRILQVDAARQRLGLSLRL
ncbi:MAG: S1 RNA-binding domain-containing protein [Anaerolineales bacterium]